MFILAGLILLVALLAFVVWPWWQSRSSSATAQDKQKSASKKKSAKPKPLYSGIRASFKFRNDTRELVKRFKQWSAEPDAAQHTQLVADMPASITDFAVWLGGLSIADLDQFAQRIARQCATVNFDPGWLYDSQVSNDPHFRQAVEDSVIAYSFGTWYANGAQQDLRVFLEYRAWLGNPSRHQEFGQVLTQVMIEQGLIAMPADLYLASEKERNDYAVSAVSQVMAENPGEFYAALHRIAPNDGSAPTPLASIAAGQSTSASVSITSSFPLTPALIRQTLSDNNRLWVVVGIVVLLFVVAAVAVTTFQGRGIP
jgi:hypothetical protein